MRRPGRGALAALVLVSAGLGAYLGRSAGTESPARPGDRPPDVILILVDTLRADHLGMYGYGRATSPRLDEWARSAVLFRQARSQAGCTFPSVNSLLTGRYAQHFVGQPEQRMGIPSEYPTVAEILRARGYGTAGVSSSTIVRFHPSKENPSAGFAAGFEQVDDDCRFGRAQCVNRAALRLVDAVPADRPLFLYVHYLEPHAAYEPAQPYRRKFALPSAEFPRWLRRGDLNPVRDWLYDGGQPVPWGEAEAEFAAGLYDEEILGADQGVTALLDQLAERGRLERAVVAFVADHGEELWEHGHIYHCRTLYDAVLRTPLVIKPPAGRPIATTVVDAPVENLDVLPTLLDYAGVPPGAARLEGRSLRPLIEGSGDPGPRPTFAQQHTLRAVTDGRHKLVLDLKTESYQLFDLLADPSEQQDVLRQERRAFHRLSAALLAHIEAVEGRNSRQRSLERAEETRKALEALGYL